MADDVGVSSPGEFHATHGGSQMRSDGFCKLLVGVAAEEHSAIKSFALAALVLDRRTRSFALHKGWYGLQLHSILLFP